MKAIYIEQPGGPEVLFERDGGADRLSQNDNIYTPPELQFEPNDGLAGTTALTDGQVQVLQTSDSDFSLSVLVPESETNRAVRLLHDRFRLAEVE